jgi:hypothetical protein
MKTKSYPFINVLFFSIVLLIGITHANAQELSLTENRSKTEDGYDIEAWTALLDQPEDYVRETFDKFIRQEYALKTEKRAKNILIVPKAKMLEIMSLRGDMRAILAPRGNSTTISLTFSPGYDIHLNKANYPTEMSNLGAMAKKYVKFHYLYYYQNLSSDTEKKIKNLQKDIERNRNRITKLKSEISENETKINSGDKQTPKLTDKNRKATENISNMETELKAWEPELEKLQQTLNQAQASIRKVNEF